MTDTKIDRIRRGTSDKSVIWSFIIGVAACLWMILPTPVASAQSQPAAQAAKQPADRSASKPPSKDEPSQDSPSPDASAAPAEHQPTSIGGELAKETREAEGEEEEHADLKHSTMVQKLAKLTGLSVHGAHLLALILNFAVIVIVLVWAVRKTAPGIMRARNESIQKALEEARRASADAGKRLADIENRLRQMDVEIGRMQSSAEKDAEGEEQRIRKAAEEDLRKVVQSAEQEIAAAAKQIRRELSVHTADLALMLARKQINVDVNTDQVLVRNFAARLAEPGKSDSQASGRNGGKDGR
jgi:F-type H+-transporting ATPase subunit b